MCIVATLSNKLFYQYYTINLCVFFFSYQHNGVFQLRRLRGEQGPMPLDLLSVGGAQLWHDVSELFARHVENAGARGIQHVGSAGLSAFARLGRKAENVVVRGLWILLTRRRLVGAHVVVGDRKSVV